jgi:hypothetical protein
VWDTRKSSAFWALLLRNTLPKFSCAAYYQLVLGAGWGKLPAKRFETSWRIHHLWNSTIRP